MKKLIISLTMLISLSFGNVLSQEFTDGKVILYDNFLLSQKIENTDLSSFNQINPIKYKLGNGFAFEKDVVYEGKDVKQVLKFNENKELEIVFFYSKSNNIDVKYLTSKPITEKESKFAKGNVKLNSSSKTFGPKDLENFKKELDSVSLDFYSGIDSKLMSTSSFIIQNKELNNLNKIENFTGLTKITTCSLVNAHKECVKCELLEGQDKEVSCGNLTIYHKVAP